MTIASLRVLKSSHGDWQPMRGSTKPAVGHELATGAVQPRALGASLREATASPAAAETPKWWDLVEQQAV